MDTNPFPELDIAPLPTYDELVEAEGKEHADWVYGEMSEQEKSRCNNALSHLLAGS